MVLRRFTDPAALHAAAADLVLAEAQAAVARSGRFSLALSGGGTPAHAFDLLAVPPRREAMPWDRVHAFWGDDRLVAPEHPESNVGLAVSRLLSRVPIPKEHVHPTPWQAASAAEAARRYAADMERFFDGPPAFDLCWQGLGPDGHTASLFPGRPSLDVEEATVAGEEEPGLDPRLPRVTLTLPALLACRTLLFVTAGEAKSALLEEMRADPAGCAARHPAARLLHHPGLVWLACP